MEDLSTKGSIAVVVLQISSLLSQHALSCDDYNDVNEDDDEVQDGDGQECKLASVPQLPQCAHCCYLMHLS